MLFFGSYQYSVVSGESGYTIDNKDTNMIKFLQSTKWLTKHWSLRPLLESNH